MVHLVPASSARPEGWDRGRHTGVTFPPMRLTRCPPQIDSRSVGKFEMADRRYSLIDIALLISVLIRAVCSVPGMFPIDAPVLRELASCLVESYLGVVRKCLPQCFAKETSCTFYIRRMGARCFAYGRLCPNRWRFARFQEAAVGSIRILRARVATKQHYRR